MRADGWNKGLGFVLVCLMAFGGAWGVYWLYKHGSYWLWYEEMVQGTIRELVKSEALK